MLTVLQNMRARKIAHHSISYQRVAYTISRVLTELEAAYDRALLKICGVLCTLYRRDIVKHCNLTFE